MHFSAFPYAGNRRPYQHQKKVFISLLGMRNDCVERV